MKIKLLTKDGGIVREGEIPPFNPPPEVLTWGSRVFARNLFDIQDGPIDYLEGLAYSLDAADAVLGAVEPQPPAAPPPTVDRSQRVLSNGSPVTADHREIDPASGQQKGYVVLSAEERAKGWVRPFRDTYRHVKCGATTTMGRPIAETYARDPEFYSGTFCATCRAHYPLTEFVWMDGSQVGS